MESAGNEYVAQLLDRAATMVDQLAREEQDETGQATTWLREYRAEKARFGQPLGSPAYVNAVQAARGGEADGTLAPAQRAESAQDGARAEDYDGRYDDFSAAELQAEAERRGLAKSGTKAELIDRLHQDDTGASAG